MKKNKSQSPLPPAGKNPSNKSQSLAFPEAISLIMAGKKVRRLEWTDLEEYCLLKDSFLMIHRNGKFHQWIVSEGDMMAVDWVVIK